VITEITDNNDKGIRFINRFLVRFGPGAGIIACAVVLGWCFEPWVWMWILAFGIYIGCKWLTYFDARIAHGQATPWKVAVYLLFWPGMDAEKFLHDAAVVRPKAGDWTVAVGKTLLGGILLLWVVPYIPHDAPLTAGWIGMTGIVFVLHFGLFHLLALAWQSAGCNARPIMRRPLCATGLADFWGRRWNLAFHQLTAVYLYRPLLQPLGPAIALLTAFFISGLIHETVITVPAGGGYGGPTAYFMIQGAGLLLERRLFFRRRPFLKRLLAWTFLIAPAAFLFPPVFIRTVILPMLTALGILPPETLHV